MNSGDILNVLFHIGDQVVRLRRTLDEVSAGLREEERTKLLAALARIEDQNVQLFEEVRLRRTHEH
ncbi:MAG TPA: hypothetical protein VKB93_17295 [Thermoanaerobaculia bacterium]|nr:hypothetical protein [Thermoanaerobaculia bacterium]